MRFQTLLVTSSIALASLARAELSFDRTTVSIKAEAGQNLVRIPFAFTNRSKREVTITKLTPSCQCTTAELTRSTFAPTARGEVIALFHITDQEGLERKSVRVETDDPGSATQVLDFEVEVPRVVQLSDKLILWQCGEPVRARTVESEFLLPDGPRFVGAVEDLGLFSFDVEQSGNGRRTRIRILPRSTAVPAQSPMTIIFRLQNGIHVTRTVFLAVVAKSH